MSESRIQNWHRAIAENVPPEIDRLHLEVAALDERRADCIALIHDLTDMLTIARRRVPEPAPIPSEPTTRPA